MAKLGRREFMATASAAAALAAGAGCATGTSGGAAVASITGPIPVVAGSDEPFRGANEQPVAGPGLPPPVLIPFGYVEEEYFVSGAVDGQPYSTTLLVRKPSDPSRFSGLVAVETIHAAGAIPMWGSGRQVWMPNGHGWVAIASQLAALDGHAKRANPTRYASLSIPQAAADPNAQTLQGAMSGGAQDRISQAIMSQVGRLLKSNSRRGPFQGMRVEKLVLGGSSQTGGTTLRYLEQSHAAERLANGGPIYDGYLPMEALSQTPVPAIDAAIMHPVTEGDVMFMGGGRPLVLRPDSDDPNGRYRHYQLTGASHVVTRGVTDPLQVFSTLGDALRPGEHLNQFPQTEFFTAFVTHFVDWVMNGTPPPRGQVIEMNGGEIVRDAHGNARGGIRSPYVDTPSVRYIAAAPIQEGDNFFRRLIGLQEPLPAAELRRLYGTKAQYLSRFDEQIDRLVPARWLRSQDAERLKQEERANPVIASLP